MEKRQLELEDGVHVDIYMLDAVIVGSGAAGMNCAERLFDSGVTDIAVVTSSLLGSTSYCAGADKQAYYKMGVLGNSFDSPVDMAYTLFDNGCMDGDLAYIESVLSLPAFYHLVENGVPFPHNQYGAYVGYKSDQDPRQRATSAGPRTSRYMVEGSLAKVRARNIPIFDHMTVVQIVTRNGAALGLVALDEDRVEGESFGITLFHANNVVLATGGPGEIYAESAYPEGQVSLHGAALEAGAGAVNLGESQFGITSTAFRWGLSGAYQQSIPSYFSMGDDGVRHNFLEDYYRSLPELASSIFLKGYQWPFNAHRVENLGSSLIDIAVSEEIGAGRHVFIDFASNPYYGDETFDIQSLPSEARNFLNKSGIRQRTPFERLEFMNPESIEVYSKQGIDLHEPVEVAVSFQHNNGGLAVNSHYETDVKGLFAVGEIAGTHGVSCPGGASLNAGQVGGIRAAEYISHHRRTGADGLSLSELGRAGRTVLLENRRMLESSGALHSVVRALIQGMMTRSAGFLRDIEPLKMACADAAALWRNCEVIAPKAADHRDIPRAWETRHLLLTAGAFMLSIYMYAGTSGGSRGSYLILQGDGPISGGGLAQVVTKHGPLFGYYIEDLQDRRHRLKVSGPELEISWEMVKPVPEDKGWFGSTWADWRDGTVFDQ